MGDADIADVPRLVIIARHAFPFGLIADDKAKAVRVFLHPAPLLGLRKVAAQGERIGALYVHGQPQLMFAFAGLGHGQRGGSRAHGSGLLIEKHLLRAIRTIAGNGKQFERGLGQRGVEHILQRMGGFLAHIDALLQAGFAGIHLGLDQIARRVILGQMLFAVYQAQNAAIG